MIPKQSPILGKFNYGGRYIPLSIVVLYPMLFYNSKLHKVVSSLNTFERDRKKALRMKVLYYFKECNLRELWRNGQVTRVEKLRVNIEGSKTFLRIQELEF